MKNMINEENRNKLKRLRKKERSLVSETDSGMPNNNYLKNFEKLINVFKETI